MKTITFSVALLLSSTATADVCDSIRKARDYRVQQINASYLNAQQKADAIKEMDEKVQTCIVTQEAYKKLAAQRQAEQAAYVKRHQEEQAKAAAEYEAHQHDGVARREELSQKICEAKQKRATAMANIAKEKKYSKIGGVIDMEYISQQQDRIREADEEIEEDTWILKESHVKQLACAK